MCDNVYDGVQGAVVRRPKLASYSAGLFQRFSVFIKI